MRRAPPSPPIARKQTALTIYRDTRYSGMARYTATEAVELVFENLVDSGDECEIEEYPAFPLPQEDDGELELERALDEPLPQCSSYAAASAVEVELDLASGGPLTSNPGK